MATLPITGLLFAGGESTRMGQDKALLTWHGEPLMLHVGQKLARGTAEVVVLSGRRMYPNLPWPQQTDLAPDLGPLGGLVTGLKVARHPWCMAVAVDMPCFHPDLPELLFSHSDSVDAVVPVPFDRPEPLCALYGQNCLAVVEASIQMGVCKMTAVLASLRVRYLGHSELAVLGDVRQIFANCNTMTEWQKLRGSLP